MTMLDRVKRMTSLVIDFPGDIEKLSVVIEQKVASEKAALEREAVALEKAVSPEFEAEFEKLEGLLSHVPGLSALVKAHDVAETAESVIQGTVAAAAPTPPPAGESDAIPTTPVL